MGWIRTLKSFLNSSERELKEKIVLKSIERKREMYYKKEKCDVHQENGQDPSSYDLILKLLGPHVNIIRDENNSVIGCVSRLAPDFRPLQVKENSEPSLVTKKVTECLQTLTPLELIQGYDLYDETIYDSKAPGPHPFK